ncbi:MAG: gliding motility-associated C-terminal domain-containing protein [Janthinobacterium lividum]
MKILSSSKPPRWGGAWVLGLLLVALGWLLPTAAHATHLRAGDIQAKVDTTPTHNPNRIFFKLTLYRDPTKQADTPVATMFFGDGTSATSNRSGDVRLTPIVNICTYYFDHTYPGAAGYTVSIVEVNRVANVVNMASSSSQSFFLSTNITIRPGLGLNHSPILKAPAIDQAASGQVYKHNPAPFDADGDSLGFRLIESRQVLNVPNPPYPAGYNPTPVVCTGFQYANSQAYGIPPQLPVQVPDPSDPTTVVGAPAKLTIDTRGQIRWNAPLRLGEYNIAFIVEEWRRTVVDGRSFYSKIGEVNRDMQVTVVATDNLPPVITIPNDTCVVAGTFIGKNVTAVDGMSATSPRTPVVLTAYGGMLPPSAIIPAGTFTQSTQGPPRAVGRFQWTPDCSNIAKEPYIVLFKAQDTPHVPAQANDPPLIDEKAWRITVIGPAPTNLQATPVAGPQVLLSWASYPCQTSTVPGVTPTILIFRRENCFAYTPSPCETGIPASAGYTQIGSVPANLTAFADNTVQRGHTYSYRIYVTFPQPAGGSSIVSNEACITLNGRSAQITNVDVLTTNATTGQISVKWTRPQPTTGSVFNTPLGYRLSRSSTGAAPFTLVTTKTSITDTTYVDTSVNTQDLQYTYQLVFFNAATAQPGSPENTETAPLASSVRLAVVPNGLSRTNALTWSYQVPWDNTKHPSIVYRRTGTTGTYSQVATVTPGATSGTYTDNDPTLQFGQTYCYYVQTSGQYATPLNSANQLIYDNLLNKSQERCAALTPTPCTPVLTLAPTNCDSLSKLDFGVSMPLQNQRYQNRLRWTIGNTPTGCSTDAAYFRIFYRSTANGPLVLLDSVAGTQFTYLHRNLTNGAGCYAVQAVNPAGIRSAMSNVACQDECVFFILPNIFTPNGDTYNETFRPKTASPIVRTHIQIFNRWGRKVYESDKDPYINWDGGGAIGETGSINGKASEGVYYYLAEVEFADFANTKRTFKGWVEITR